MISTQRVEIATKTIKGDKCGKGSLVREGRCKAALPNLFGTKDRFHGGVEGGWFRC